MSSFFRYIRGKVSKKDVTSADTDADADAVSSSTMIHEQIKTDEEMLPLASGNKALNLTNESAIAPELTSSTQSLIPMVVSTVADKTEGEGEESDTYIEIQSFNDSFIDSNWQQLLQYKYTDEYRSKRFLFISQFNQIYTSNSSGCAAASHPSYLIDFMYELLSEEIQMHTIARSSMTSKHAAVNDSHTYNSTTDDTASTHTYSLHPSLVSLLHAIDIVSKNSNNCVYLRRRYSEKVVLIMTSALDYCIHELDLLTDATTAAMTEEEDAYMSLIYTAIIYAINVVINVSSTRIASIFISRSVDVPLSTEILMTLGFRFYRDINCSDVTDAYKGDDSSLKETLPLSSLCIFNDTIRAAGNSDKKKYRERISSAYYTGMVTNLLSLCTKLSTLASSSLPQYQQHYQSSIVILLTLSVLTLENILELQFPHILSQYSIGDGDGVMCKVLSSLQSIRIPNNSSGGKNNGVERLIVLCGTKCINILWLVNANTPISLSSAKAATTIINTSDFLGHLVKSFDYMGIPINDSKKTNASSSICGSISSQCVINCEYSYKKDIFRLPYDIWPWIKDGPSPTAFPYMHINTACDGIFSLCNGVSLFTILDSTVTDSISTSYYNFFHTSGVVWKILFDSVAASLLTGSITSSHAYVTSLLSSIETLSTRRAESVAGHVPIFQVFFISMLDAILMENPLKFIQVFEEVNLARLILGVNFLQSGTIEDTTNTLDDDAYYTMQTKAISKDHVSFTWTSNCDDIKANAVVAYAWANLHDQILDLLLKIVTFKYSFIDGKTFKLPSARMDQEINEVNRLLADIGRRISVDSLCHSSIFRLSRWLTNVLMLNVPQKERIRSLIGNDSMKTCINIAIVHLRAIGVTSIDASNVNTAALSPATINNDKLPIKKDDVFLLAARVSVLKLIILVYSYLFKTTVGFGLDIFTDDSEEIVLDSLGTDRGPHDRSESVVPTIRAGSACIKKLTLMLLDPLSRSIAMQILAGIIVSALRLYANSKKDIDIELKVANYNRSSIESKKLQQIGVRLQTVIVDTVRGCAHILQECPNYPIQFDAFNTAEFMLHMLTWCMRCDMFETLCPILQECLRSSDSIQLMLTAFIGCCNNMKKVEGSVGRFKAGGAKLLQQGLSFFSGIMMNNESCQRNFGSALASIITVHGNDSGKSKSLAINDFVSGIVNFEKISIETILILMEMVLDCTLNRYHSLVRNKVTSDKNLLVNGLFCDEDDRPPIKNYAIVPILFLILPGADTSVQRMIFNTFRNLLSGRASLINLDICATKIRPTSVLELALDCFYKVNEEIQEYAVMFIQTLGRHAISVRELKHLFHMLQSRDYEGLRVRPSYTSKLLQSMHGMISNDNNPRHSFVLDGKNSGLLLPPIKQWPAMSGFTFSMWLRVESPKVFTDNATAADANNTYANSTNNVYKPYILSLRSDGHGFGIDVYLVPIADTNHFKIILKSYTDKVDVFSPELEGMYVVEGKWTFIAISLQIQKYRQKSYASVLVNDQFARRDFVFNKFKDEISKPLFGDCPTAFKASGTSTENTTMRGQVGAIYFFSDTLTEGQLRGIYALGSDYFYCFESSSLSHQNNKQNSTRNNNNNNPTVILDGSLTGLIILALNPAVWNFECFLDNSPSSSKVQWRLGTFVDFPCPNQLRDGAPSEEMRLYARPLPGTHRSNTQDIKMVFHSLGGIKTLLPIFERLDQPRLLCVDKTYRIDHSIDTDLSLTLLKFLDAILVNSDDNVAMLKKISYFSLIVHFLQDASPKHFSSDLMQVFKSIYHKYTWNSFIQQIILDQVFCNFNLWVYCPYQLQVDLFDWLLAMSVKTPLKVRDVMGVQRLLDTLYIYYDYDKPCVENPTSRLRVRTASIESVESYESNSTYPMSTNTDKDGTIASTFTASSANESKNILDGGTFAADNWVTSDGTVHGSKLKGEELSIIRSKLFSILSNTIYPTDRMTVLPEDIMSVISYITHASSVRSKIEAMVWLYTFICSNTSILPRILTGVSLSQFMPLLASHCNHSNVSFRMISFVMLCKIITIAIEHDVLPVALPKDSSIAPDKATALKAMNISFFQPITVHATSASMFPVNYDSVKVSSDYARTFDSLGLHIASLATFLSYITNHLIENVDDNDISRDKQCEIVAIGLYLTLFGELCDDLFKTVRMLFSYSGVDQEALVKFDIPSNNLSCVAQEAKIMLPMLLPALLHFLSHDKISTNLRLLILVKLKSSITLCDTNADQILHLPDWQNAFFTLIASEKSRLRRLVFEQESSNCSDVAATAKKIGKCEAIIDTCTTMMTDLIIKALHLGLPLKIIQSLRDIDDKVFTISQTYEDICNQVRNPGANVLHEAIVAWALYYEQGLLDMKDGTILILNTVAALNDPNHSLRQGDSDSSTTSSTCVKDYNDVISLEKMRYLNIWIVSGVVLDIMTYSLHKPATAPPPSPEHDKASSSRSRSHPLQIDLPFEILMTLMPLVSCYISKPPSWISSEATDDWNQQFSELRDCSKGIATSLYNDRDKDTIPLHVNYSSGGTCWVILRLILSYINQSNLNHCDGPDNITACIQELTIILRVCKAKRVEYFSFESMNIIAHLIHIADETHALPAFTKINEHILQLIVEASIPQVSLLTLLLTSKPPAATDSITRDSNDTGNDNSSNKEVLAHLLSKFEAARGVAPIQESMTYEDISQYNSTVDKDGVKDAISNVFNVLLSSRETEITWERCRSFMDMILMASLQIEEQALSKRLLQLGSWRSSQKIISRLSCRCDSEIQIQIEWSKLSIKKMRSVQDKENDRFYEQLRNLEQQRRRNESRWKEIYLSLSNDRGPWGFGVENERDVYWTCDAAENDNRMRMRIIRNPYGSKHQMASQAQRGDPHHSYNYKGDNNGLFAAKDLLQYKTLPILKAEDMNERGNDDEDEDDDNVTMASSTTDATSSISKNSMSNSDQSDNETVLLVCDNIEIITNSTTSSGGQTIGSLEVTKNRITFIKAAEDNTQDLTNKTAAAAAIAAGVSESLWTCKAFNTKSWHPSEVTAMYQRHYLLQFTAIELFFTSRTSVFINLQNTSSAKSLYKCILKQVRPPHMFVLPHRKPEIAIKRSIRISRVKHAMWMQTDTVQQAWIQREISNYEYLMLLNTIAGRTFNDLGQYPVFPWILSNYTSKKLDLRDPKNYRDLQWPMGALTKEQRASAEARYNDSLESYQFNPTDEFPPFHHGTHYSTAAFVYWYLVRLEPFTSLHVQLQSGKFDKADRLFNSIEATWDGALMNNNDVKELVPEFFYCPEFLENVNGIDLGNKQDGTKINSVVLPAWARNAHEFIQIHREALESEYVSRNLHHWINLIFGYKQRPPTLPKGGGDKAAIDACNVFFHLTYVDAIDNLEMMKVNDKQLYNSYVRQIDNFGQTPVRLFESPHPPRQRLIDTDFIWPIASILRGSDTVPRDDKIDRPLKLLSFPEYRISKYPLVFLSEIKHLEQLVIIDSNRVYGVHTFKVKKPDVVPPFILEIAGSGGKFSSFFNSKREKHIGVPFASRRFLSYTCPSISNINYDLIGKPSNKELLVSEEIEKINGRRSKKGTSRTSSVSTTVSQTMTPPRKLASSISIESLESPSKSPSTTSIGSLSQASSIQSADVVSVASASTLNYLKKPSKEVVDEHISSKLFASLPDTKLLFSCGHWDNSFKATIMDSGKVIQSIAHHSEVVTCVDVASDSGQFWVVTGSRDCTVAVWEVIPDREYPVSPIPLHVLYGHDGAVTCIAVNTELDTLVSGSNDGTLIINTLREGLYVRSITIGYYNASMTSPTSPGNYTYVSNVQHRRSVQMVAISKENYIVAYSSDGNLLCCYTINGRLIKIIDANEKLYTMCISEDGLVLITGGERCLIVFRFITTLRIAITGGRSGLEAVTDGSNSADESVRKPFTSAIRCLHLTANERLLLVGLDSGEFRILAQDSDYLKKRLTAKLHRIGILSSFDM